MANINRKPLDDNGDPHGEWIIFHDNNQIAYRENYINNAFHGLQESYFEDGRVYYRGYYNMGKRIGYWYIYERRMYFLELI